MDTTVDASARPHGGHGGPPPMPSHSTLMIDGRALLATRRAGTTTRTAGEGVAPGVAEAGAEEEEEGEEVFAIDGTLEETLAYHVEHPPAPLPSTTALASARVCADAEGCDPLVVRRDELVLPLFDEIWRALLLEVRPSPPPSFFALRVSLSLPPHRRRRPPRSCAFGSFQRAARGPSQPPNAPPPPPRAGPSLAQSSL